MKKNYKVSKENLINCYNDQNIVDVKLASEKFGIPEHMIKSNCRELKLRYSDPYLRKKLIETIQCPVCTWSGNIGFTSHIFKSKDEKHEEWMKNLISLYNDVKSSYEVAGLNKLSPPIIKTLLKAANVLKSSNTNLHKCPICNWENICYFPKHIRESNDNEHNKFKQDVIRKYVNEEMSPAMIANEYKIAVLSVTKILVDLGIKTRNHHESVINAIKHDRHNINAYGIGGYRSDLNNSFRSIPEANFARILKYNNIVYKKEVAYNLYDDESMKLLSTYFLDFLINDDQGIEIKGYGDDYNFKNKEKISLFIKQYPNIKLKVIYCTSEEWKNLEKEYMPLIPLWETQVKNLKTHPELYS
jgi:hypothetical protein